MIHPPPSAHLLPAWVDLVAMVVAGAFGAHVARRRHIPIAGELLAGVIVGLGGGIARDILLGLEPVAITTWFYIPAVLVASIIGASAARRVNITGLPFVAAQGLSIGLLIGIGVQQAVKYRAPAPSAILLGVVTGTFGGAFADVLAGRRATIMQENHWLLSAVLIGSVTFYLFTIYIGFYTAVVITVAVVVLLRVLSVHFDWTSPVFPGDEPWSEDR